MIAISIIGVGIILLLVGTYIVRMNQLAQRSAHSLQLILRTKDLISCAQKHRGLTASYLQGNQGVKPMIIQLRQNIAAIQRNLQDSALIGQQERWSSFIDHWPRLKENSFNLSVQESFTQHTNLIENLLYLLEDIAESWQLYRSSSISKDEFRYLWHELPLAVECIGQARAVGMAVSTAGVSTQIDKVKLGYLHEKILNLSNIVFKQINAGNSGTILVNNAKHACQDLANTIEREFIKSNKVVINSDQYFSLASQTMESMNSILDTQLQQLKSSDK